MQLKILVSPKTSILFLRAHREENVDQKERLEELVESLRRIKGEYRSPDSFFRSPAYRKKLTQYGFKLDDIVVRHKPFAFTDYVALQQKAYCVLSDSGTISEESSILGFPAVNLRYTHERQEAMEKAVVVMANLDKGNIPTAIKTSRRQRDNGVVMNPIDDYRQECVSDKILRIILSYTDYVNEESGSSHPVASVLPLKCEPFRFSYCAAGEAILVEPLRPQAEPVSCSSAGLSSWSCRGRRRPTYGQSKQNLFAGGPYNRSSRIFLRGHVPAKKDLLLR